MGQRHSGTLSEIAAQRLGVQVQSVTFEIKNETGIGDFAIDIRAADINPAGIYLGSVINLTDIENVQPIPEAPCSHS